MENTRWITQLRPCPFCGAGETHVREQTYWTGKRSALMHVEIHHWCEPMSTELRSFLTIKGKTYEEAVAAWEGAALLRKGEE